MLYWIPFAFVRITVFFIAGIVIALYFPHLLAPSIAAGLMLLLISLYSAIFFFNRSRRKQWVNPGLTGLLTVLVAGYANVLFENESLRDDHLGAIDHVVYYEATVNRFGQEKETSWKEVVDVTRVYNGQEWISASGKVLLYLPRKSYPDQLRYGDRILVKGSPQKVTGPGNPFEFDYRKYLADRNIFHQHFLGRDTLMWLRNEPDSRLIAVSVALRRWSDATLEKYVEGEREQAIASALVLGVTDGLDNELMGAYASTGAMHVLSVSGLHVGILYMVLSLLLKPLSRFRQGKWIIAGVSLLFLWVYACVTGLSPSVMRAVTMFSIVVVARPLGQRTNIYNVLAASAFCLLLFDPFLVLSVGFQLSYLAVLGIVYLQPLLYRLVEPQSRIVDEIWKVTSVSIAAQIATFSLGFLYFHQFPNYFLLSNLYVLPLGFAILVGGLVLLVCSFLSVVASFIGLLLTWVIKSLNYLIFLTDGLPYSVIDGIYINAFQCFALMIMVAKLILFLERRKMWSIYVAGCAAMLFAVLAWQHHLTELRQPRLAVYRVAGYSAIDLIDRGVAYAFVDTLMDDDKRKYHVAPNRLFRRAGLVVDGKSQAFSQALPFGNVVSWHGKTLLLVSTDPPRHLLPIKVDYLILSDNAIRSLDRIPESLSAQIIIIDSSNSFALADKLVKENAGKNWNVYSVWHEGAFDKTI